MSIDFPVTDRERGLVRLQYVGLCDGTRVDAVQVGDTLVWNTGTTSTVTAIDEVSPKFLVVTEESRGRQYARKMRKDRLVVVADERGKIRVRR